MMIRVLQVMSTLDCGGAENMIMNLYRNIDRDKVQFDFIVHKKEKCFFEEEIEKLGGRIYHIPKYKLYNHFLYKKSWNVFFKNHKEYKILHCHIRSVASIILKIAKKYKIITISHSHSTSNGKGIKAFIKNIFQKKITKTADYLFACSEEAANWLFGDKIKNNIFIINNAIDYSRFIYDEKLRNKIRKKYNINENDILLGHVGRFIGAKNHIFLIDLLKKISLKNKNYKLMLIGEGELKNSIKKIVAKYKLEDKVIFVDNTLNVNEYYSAFDYFLMPSKFEGLGIVLIEAQFNGIKCIASKNIPKESKISNNIYYLELDIDKWISKIENGSERKSELLKSADKYDIKKVATWITEFYINIID